ncbi:hypothetical protein DFH27DRAFT_582379 [Peziza echinospora]|nr:hypothetical protein DFH27DRAFT_582379 [Peziza echinospora]
MNSTTPTSAAAHQVGNKHYTIALHNLTTGTSATLEYTPITPAQVIQNYTAWTEIVSAKICHAFNRPACTPYQLSTFRNNGGIDITLGQLISAIECPSSGVRWWATLNVRFNSQPAQTLPVVPAPAQQPQPSPMAVLLPPVVLSHPRSSPATTRPTPPTGRSHNHRAYKGDGSIRTPHPPAAPSLPCAVRPGDCSVDASKRRRVSGGE